MNPQRKWTPLTAWLGTACVVLLFGTSARAEPIDVSIVLTDDVVSSHLVGAPGNTVLDFDLTGAGVTPGSELLGLSWDVNIEAFDPSWLSDLSILFSSAAGSPSDGFSLNVSDMNQPGTEHSTSPLVLLKDYGLPNLVLGDGILRLEFFERQDDPQVDPDGVWRAGSTFRLRILVPEPSSALLFLGGLALVAGLARTRPNRRRGAA